MKGVRDEPLMVFYKRVLAQSDDVLQGLVTPEG